MSNSPHNLLTEPVVRARLVSGSVEALSLPAVLARLSAGDDIESFVALRHHQRHAWFAFLVQLATMALHRAGQSKPPKDAPTWRDLLLALTAGDEAPYCLVGPDLSRPAFLQPPVPEGSLEKFKSAGVSADGLDIVITAKNHDLKAERISHPKVDDWIYALVTLQTMQGFLGRGNYGVVRMNGGFGNRPCVTYAPSLRWGARFMRDTRVLLGAREELAAEHGYRSAGGVTLLWLSPWDGKKGSEIQLTDCDPYFIEICRRVRFQQAGEQIMPLSAPTSCARIDDAGRLGDVGDPWTPVSRSSGKALTVSARGFHFRLIQQLLFRGEHRRGVTQRLYPQDDAPLLFHVETLVRGQGETGGYHVRSLPLSSRIRATLMSAGGRDRLAERAEAMIEVVDLIVKSVFRPALLSLLQAAPDKLDFKDNSGDAWTQRLDSWADRAFFEQLFGDLELDVDVASNRWARALLDMAQSLLEEAMRSVPLPSIRRYRAEAIATRIFHGAARRRFPDLFLAKKEAANDQA